MRASCSESMNCKMLIGWIVILTVCPLLCVSVMAELKPSSELDKQDEMPEPQGDSDDQKRYPMPPVDPLQIYQRWFRVRRAEHLSAVKQMLKSDYSRQQSLVKVMLDAMKKTLLEKRTQLGSSQFLSGDSDFPTDEGVKEQLSVVLENSALFVDMALRLPDATTGYLKKDQDFAALIKWAVQFSNSTGFLDAVTVVAVDLAAQELNWVQRTDDYSNPYSLKQQQKIQLEQQIVDSQKKKTQKKEKKVKEKKGPRMGGGTRKEL